jgi:hypothetical protein
MEAVAEVPGAEHPRSDVQLRPPRGQAERVAHLGFLILLQELAVGGAPGPLLQLAVKRGDRGETHRDAAH